MQILVDADALPNAIKAIIFRAAERTQINLIFVANQFMRIPNKQNISMIKVAKGPDEADDYIVENVRDGDLVITADIPLADRVISKQAYALDPRGELFTEGNIKSRLATRDLMEQLRNEGILEGGPSSYNARNAQLFTNQLDRFLTKHTKII
jgi:uncharacterized protein